MKILISLLFALLVSENILAHACHRPWVIMNQILEITKRQTCWDVTDEDMLKVNNLKISVIGSIVEMDILVPEYLYGLKHLQYLTINKSTMYEIRANAFADNKQLVFLGINKTNIQSFQSELLADLSELKYIDISDNMSLSYIEPGSFSSLSSVLELNLSENNLTEIEAGLLSGIRKAYKIDLSRNKISKIEDGAFSDLGADVALLDLSRNRITHISDKNLQDLRYVSSLDLSNNRIALVEREKIKNALPLTDVIFY